MKKIIAVVGMPGSGKTEATKFLENKNFFRIRFGDITEEEVKKRGLKVNEENERKVREELRKEKGMDVYARLNENKIRESAEKKNVVIDGLYSMEEYLYLKEKFPEMVVAAVYASPKTRYERLEKRKIRPLDKKECKSRDIAQLENLHTGGPIAMADFTINNEFSLKELLENISILLKDKKFISG